MPIVSMGPYCARRGCRGPAWQDELCPACWRLARMFGKDPKMFAFVPLHGYADDRDAVELPWDRLGEEAEARDISVADVLAEKPPDDGTDPRGRTP